MPGRAAARQDGKRQRGGRHGHAGREWRVAGGLAARVGQDCHGVRPLSVQDDDLVLYGRQVPDRGLVPVGRAAAVLLRVPARERLVGLGVPSGGQRGLRVVRDGQVYFVKSVFRV